jgi:hypothetical protein
MKAFVLLSASALGGLCLGLTIDSGRRPSGRSALRAEAEALPSEPSGERSSEAPVPVVLPGQTEVESFASLPPERQGEVLQRWVSKRSVQRSSSDELTMLRAVKTLTYEQAAALLESLASAPAGKGDSADFVRVALKERLAALDPKLALEQGRQRGDTQLRSAAVVALMQKNAAEGLRAVAQLSEKERERIWDLAGSFTKPGGTIQDLTALLKEMPEVGKVSEISIGMEGSLAYLAARIMAADPARGLGELRRIEAELLAAKGVTSSGPPEQQQQPLHLILGMMMELRSLSPEAARTVFDALSEAEKSNFVVSMEAAARLKETGADAAIRFAETQTNENFVKEAARGVWQALALEDRTSALQWIESLPEGPFREGVFSSVMREALMRSRTSRNAQDAVQAGAELLSTKTQLDYYSYLVSKNPLAPSEVIAGLPISEADKQELQRRAAPVKPQ